MRRFSVCCLLLSSIIWQASAPTTHAAYFGAGIGGREADFVRLLGQPDSNSKPGALDYWHPCATSDTDRITARFYKGFAIALVYTFCGDAIGAQEWKRYAPFWPDDAIGHGTTYDKTLGRLHLFSSAQLAHALPRELYQGKTYRADCDGDPLPAGAFFVAGTGAVTIRIGGCLR